MADAAPSAVPGQPAKRRRRWLAALLSLFWPGLGQAYLGAAGRGSAWAAAALAWNLLYRGSPYAWAWRPALVPPLLVLGLLGGGLALSAASAVDGFRRGRAPPAPRPRWPLRWAVYVVLAFVPALPGLAADVQWSAYRIPSASMLPTMPVGDRLLAAAGYYTRFAPERGDIAVFRPERNPGTLFVKRIVGLPGDRVQLKGGVVWLDGTPVGRTALSDYAAPAAPSGCAPGAHPRFRESLPAGRSHQIVLGCAASLFEDTPEFLVPPGHYFMLGDNRDNSEDSRDPGAGVGYVPAASLVARAAFVAWSADGGAAWWQFWRWPLALRWSRIGLAYDE